MWNPFRRSAHKKAGTAERVGLVVVSDDGCAVFTNVAGAQGYLEAQDVEEGTYPVAYDPDGRVFRIEAVGVSRWDPGKVAITPTGHTDAQALRDLIERTVLGTNSEDVPIGELAQRLAPRIIC